MASMRLSNAHSMSQRTSAALVEIDIHAGALQLNVLRVSEIRRRNIGPNHEW